MITNPVHSTPAAQNEAAVQAAPRPNTAPQSASTQQDKVTLSPQAQAQASAQAKPPASADKNHDGDSK